MWRCNTMFLEYVEFSLRQLWWERWWRAVYGRIPHLNRKVRELATLFYRDIAEISWAHKKGSLVQNKWFASWDVISFFSSLIWCFFIDLTGHFRFAGSVRPSRRGVFSRRQYDIWNPQVRAIFAKSWTWTMTFLVLLEDHMTWKTWLNYQADPSGGLVVESSAQMALFLPVFFF